MSNYNEDGFLNTLNDQEIIILGEAIKEQEQQEEKEGEK